MAMLPVIVRELRAQSRQPITYWLRMAGCISLGCAFAFALWEAHRAVRGEAGVSLGIAGSSATGGSPFQAFGVALFGKLNLFTFASIWLFVPLAAADAISRERREGTLVLLHLTQLGSLGIVVGKAFVHMLRSLSLLLSLAPWLMLPVLFGGVELRDVEMALLIDLSSVLLAMSAGLLASTLPRDWLKSAIQAEVFAAVLLLSLLHAHGSVLRHAATTGLPPGLRPGTPAFWQSRYAYLQEFFPGYYGSGLIERTRRLALLATNGSFDNRSFWGFRRGVTSEWQQLWSGLTPTGQKAWRNGVLGMLAGSGLLLAAAAGLGALLVSRSWQDAPQGGRTAEWKRRWFTPRFAVVLLSRRLARTLTANPIGWLQVHSPPARLVKWAWCAFLIVVEIVLSRNETDLYDAQAGLGLLLLLGLTFSATGSFREELQTGAFELLLVTPIHERQIVWGRARGLWQQFLPAFLVFGAGCFYLGSGWSDKAHSAAAWLVLSRSTIAFCTLPLIGLFFSLQRWNFFAAWLAACLVGMLPFAVGRILGVAEWKLLILHLGITLAAVILLEFRLKNRRFLQARERS